jgi:hypothetical protein
MSLSLSIHAVYHLLSQSPSYQLIASMENKIMALFLRQADTAAFLKPAGVDKTALLARLSP